jgi:hypothetical protein
LKSVKVSRNMKKISLPKSPNRYREQVANNFLKTGAPRV